MTKEHSYINKPLFGSQLNLSHPLTKGLVGCWLMNDNGYRLFDYSPYNNNGTLIGFTSPVYTLGQRSTNGIEFNDSTTYINCGNDESLNFANEFTIESIFRLDIDVVGNGYIITKNSTGTVDMQYGLLYDNLTKELNIYINGGSRAQSSVNSILPGIWYHTIITYNGIEICYYINGTLYTTTAYTSAITQTSFDVNIGRRQPNDIYFHGKNSLLRMWNIGLNANDAKQLYNNTYDMFIN